MTDVTAADRAKRNSVFLRALVELPGTLEVVERRVRNLSATGACIDSEGDLATGMNCRMQMGCLKAVNAEIVWATDRQAGVRFDRTVDLDSARRPRGHATMPKEGWIATIDDPYRR